MVTAGVGCNGGDGGAVIGTSDTGTGSIAFSVNWDEGVPESRGAVQTLGPSGQFGNEGPSKRATVDRAAADQVASALGRPDDRASGDLPMALAGPINCDEAGVAEVQAEVYDNLGRLLAVGGPWGCAAHSGTIEDVPAGSDRKVVVKGMSAEGKEYYKGEIAGITVTPGELTTAGMIDAIAVFSIDFRKLEYRNFPNANWNRYQGFIEISKAGKPVMPAEIVKIQLLDGSGNPFPTQAPDYFKGHYFKGSWNSSAGTVSFEKLIDYSEYGFRFPGTEPSEGSYTFEVTTVTGQVLSDTFYFPGKEIVSAQPNDVIEVEWLTDGSLRISWVNPTGDFDANGLWVDDQDGQGLFAVNLPPDVEEITIPAGEIEKVTNSLGPISGDIWLRVRSYTEEGMTYARGYFVNKEIPWNDVTIDLFDYWPIAQGNTWLHRNMDNELNLAIMEGFETIHGVEATQVTIYESDFENMTTPEGIEWYSHDSDFIYVHGERELSGDYNHIGLYVYDPSLRLKRFVKIGESFTSESVLPWPDGSQYVESYTWEILGFEDVNVPAGSFPNCVKIQESHYSESDDESSVDLSWWAKGVGQVMSREIEPFEGGWAEWLLSASIVGDAENITIPWMPQFQFRQHSDPTQNRYGAWLDLKKNGTSILEEDVTNIELRANDYTSIPIDRIEYSNQISYSAYWDYGQGRFVFGDPGASSGFGFSFPENSEYSPGYYVWEVTTSSGDVATQPFYFPGKRELPVPDAQLMSYEWLADGSLALSWSNPIGEYDRVQVGMHKEDDTDLFYCTFDSSLNLEELVIPADVVQSMTILRNPQTALWTMRVRVHGDDGMMYARAYSDVVEIPWTGPTFTIPLATISIDGDRNDWAGIQPAFVDEVGDEDPDADFAGADISELYLSKDNAYYYFMIRLFDGSPLENMLYVFWARQSQFTVGTPGDLYTHFNLSNGDPQINVHEVDEQGQYVHVAFYSQDYGAAGLDFVEWRVPVEDIESLNDKYIRVYTHHILGDSSTPVSDHNMTAIRLIDN